MKAVRRFGFMLWVLLMGNCYWLFWRFKCCSDFCPLMMLWFMLWDEKKFRQAERKRNRHYYHDHDFIVMNHDPSPYAHRQKQKGLQRVLFVSAF